jgi:O-Antigen ligase
VENQQFGEVIARSVFRRVTGTATHPIEFGVVLSAVLPLTIHFARFADTVTKRRWWWAATATIGFALPLSVARSAAIGGLIAIAILFPTWPRRLQARMAIAGAAGILVMTFAVPGLLGTIRGLFINASSDPSTTGRTADYKPVMEYTAQHPLFGRGIGTFIPGIYRTLDNAYLGLLVEAGIIGLLAFLTLLVGTIVSSGIIRHRAESESMRDLAQCLIAGIAVILVNSATFDALNFPMCAGTLFLLIGGVGSLWTIQKTSTATEPAPAKPASKSAPIRSLSAVAAAAVILPSTWALATAHPGYQAYGAVVLTTSRSSSGLALAGSDFRFTASVLLDVMQSQSVRDDILGGTHADFEVNMDDGSLAKGTDLRGELSPILQFVATSRTAADADVMLAKVLHETSQRLAKLQVDAGVSSGNLIRISVIQHERALPVFTRRTRGAAALLIILLATLIAFYPVWRRRRGTTSRARRPASRPVPAGSPARAVVSTRSRPRQGVAGLRSR